jgi:hypothetical protein
MKTEKLCKLCNQVKKIEEFPLNSPDAKGRRYYMSKCKKCMTLSVKPYVQKYMKENPERWKEYGKNTRNKRAELLKELRSEGCVKCKDKRYYVIDFHHLDPSKKDISVSDASISKIKSEVKKCILLCRNCHAEFHHQEKIKGITINEYLAWNPEETLLSSVLDEHQKTV